MIFKLRTLDFDVKKEVEAIFKSKFINFIRNPYSIKKVLNTFPQLKNYQPTGSPHNEHFSRIIHGVRPHQKYLCDQLEITDKEYAEWLSVIFLLTTSLMDGHENILEKSISGLINNPDIYTMVYVYTYSDETCLLSDRGYSIPLPDDEHMAWDFNLCRAGFIRYVFVNINSIAGAFASKDRIDDFKISKKAIYFSCVHDDFDILQRYNKNVVYQCYSRVFNAKNNCYGLV